MLALTSAHMRPYRHAYVARRRLRHALRRARSSSALATATVARHRVHEYRPRRHRRTAAGDRRARCRRTGRCRTRTTSVDVPADAVPAAIARSRRSIPTTVVGIGTDFTASHRRCRRWRDGTPLCELPELRGPAARLRRSSGSTTPPSRRPTAINALAAERGEPWLGPLRRADLVRVGVRQGAAGARGGPGGLRPRPSAGSRPPTGSSGSSAASRPATPAPPATRASTRTGATRRADYLRRAQPATSPTSSRQARASAVAARRARRRPDRARRPRWTGLPEGIASRSATSTPTSPRRRRRRSSRARWSAIMGTSTCHVMNGDALAEVPGMCGVVDGGITPGLWGYEAGQSGVGDIFAWFVDNSVPAAYHDAAARGLGVHEYLTELAAAAGGRRARARRARLARAATARCSSTTSSRGARRRADPGDDARGHLSRAGRGDRVRDAQDRRGVRGGRRAGRASSSSPAGCSRTRC